MPLALLSLFGGLKGGLSTIVGSIPKPIWEALAVLGYVLALYALHTHYVHTHNAALIAANDAKWQARLAEISADVAKKDAEIVQISVQLRKANDEENRRIAADAGNLLVLGPGKAACPRISAAPAPPSGIGNGRPGDAPLAQVPDAGGQPLIALPLDDTISFGADHDYWRARALSWDDWYAKLVQNWPRK